MSQYFFMASEICLSMVSGWFNSFFMARETCLGKVPIVRVIGGRIKQPFNGKLKTWN